LKLTNLKHSQKQRNEMNTDTSMHCALVQRPKMHTMPRGK